MPIRAGRKVKVTERRTATDFAACMRDLGDIHVPEADRIRVVLDNHSTHTQSRLGQLNFLQVEQASPVS